MPTPLPHVITLLFFTVLVDCTMQSALLAENDVRVRKVPGSYGVSPIQLNLYFGDPPQLILTQVDLQFGELLVVDSACGQKTRTCPKYCTNEVYRELFCGIPGCRQMNSVETRLRCPGNQRYFAANSTTFEDSDEEWVHPYIRSMVLRGRYATDQMSFGTGAMLVKGLRIVRGLYLDRRLSNRQSAILGLAPSQNALPVQAYNRGHIARPLCAFFPTFVSGSNGLYMRLGSEDAKNTCVGWIRRNSASEKAWAVDVSEIEIAGVKARNAKILFDATQIHSTIPRQFVERLLRESDFTWDRQLNLLYYTPKMDITLILRFADGKEFRVDRRLLLFYYIGETFAARLRVADDPDRYQEDGDVWRLGASFFFSHCVTFDYAKKEVSLGYSKFFMDDE